VGPLQRGLAFNEWLRLFRNPQDFLECSPPFNKAIYHQFVEVFASIPPARRQGAGKDGYRFRIPRSLADQTCKTYDRHWLEVPLPGLRLIELTRSPVDQAVSTYIARVTKKYHIYTEVELREYLETKIDLDASCLLEIYGDIQAISGCWRDFRPDHQIAYEDLVRDPVSALSQILPGVDIEKALTKSQGENRRIFPMSHPARVKLVSLLNSLRMA
jgi:hypothetical protein